MPRDSNPKERESWPAIWKNHWKKTADAEDKTHDEQARKNNRPTKPQIDKATKVLCLDNLDIPAKDKLTDETVKKWFKILITKFSFDKMTTSGPDRDPREVDCTTPAKRKQAWLTRAQDLIAAKADLLARNKYGARMNYNPVNGTWY